MTRPMRYSYFQQTGACFPMVQNRQRDQQNLGSYATEAVDLDAVDVVESEAMMAGVGILRPLLGRSLVVDAGVAVGAKVDSTLVDMMSNTSSVLSGEAEADD